MNVEIRFVVKYKHLSVGYTNYHRGKFNYLNIYMYKVVSVLHHIQCASV